MKHKKISLPPKLLKRRRVTKLIRRGANQKELNKTFSVTIMKNR